MTITLNLLNYQNAQSIPPNFKNMLYLTLTGLFTIKFDVIWH